MNGFWLFMLICSLLTPLTMLFIGRSFKNNPPKEINGIYGYRTKRSRQSKEAWELAHIYCGKIWQTAGMIMLPLSAAAMLPFFGSSVNTTAIAVLIIVTLQTLVMCLTIIPVETALKKKFGK